MKVIKYIVRDKNRLMIEKQLNKQLYTFIRDSIFKNVSPLILVDNIIFWDLLEDMRPGSIDEN